MSQAVLIRPTKTTLKTRQTKPLRVAGLPELSYHHIPDPFINNTQKTHQVDNPFPSLPPLSSGPDAPKKCQMKPGTHNHRRELAAFRKVISGKESYGFTPQKWITAGMKLTPTRRNWIMAILFEAGCGQEMCYTSQFVTDPDDWSIHLHRFWHELVGSSKYAFQT